MLTTAQRARLAEFQIEKHHWFRDNEFNFGPIVCRENFSPAALTSKNWREFLRVEPLPNAPPPITVAQPWDCTPDLFKNQFRLAYASTNEFREVNARLDELGNILRIAGSKLAAGDPLKEIPIIAHYLFMFGSELRDLAEFSKVFKIPKCHYSEKKFKHFLEQIRESFRASNLLLPTKTYDLHTGTKFSSQVIKNRRRVVRQHVLTIEKWIRAAYPPQTPEPGATASRARLFLPPAWGFENIFTVLPAFCPV